MVRNLNHEKERHKRAKGSLIDDDNKNNEINSNNKGNCNKIWNSAELGQLL